MSVSIAQIRSRVETDLDDATLTLILNAETEALEREVGAESEVETHLATGNKKLVLRRKPESIDEIVERRHLLDTTTTLSGDDYRILGERILYRLGDGTNPEDTWGDEVVITYTAEIDSNLRDRVLIDLVLLSVEFSAYKKQDVGDWTGDQGDYFDRRKKVFAQIREPRAAFV